MTDPSSYSDELTAFVEFCGDPSDPECQVRVVVRQPALVINQSEIPIQEVAELSNFANTASFAFTAVSASYLTSDVLLGDLPNVWYVSEQGSDTYTGKTLEKAYRTIKKAAQEAKLYIESSSDVPKPRATIIVATGYYEEEAPIVVPPFTSIIGNDLRTAVVRPTYATRKQNLFLMNNGTYAYGLRLEGCEIDDLNNPRSGFFFALDNGAYLVTSPYIQNCTAAHTPANKFYVPLNYQGTPQPNPEVGNGPGGMIVDDSVLDGYSPLKSMIVDAYTQVAFNGMGLVVRGEGYAQQVSFFTNFSHVGVWAIDGGHASLLNSNTTFGDYGLRSTGKRILVVADADGIPTQSDATASALITAEKQSIINNMMYRLQLSGSYSASYIDSSSAIYQATIKDSGILVDSIASDLLGKPGRMVNFTQGLFKAQDTSTGSIYTLPSASGFDKGVITSFRVNDIFRYSEASCSRDVGYIIDALITDMLYGGNERSIEAARYYYLYPSVATTTQLQKTLDGIRFAGHKAIALTPSASAESSSIASNLETILDIIENGTGSIPPVTFNIESTIKRSNQSQYTGSASASASEGTFLSESINLVKDIITNGTGSLPPLVTYTTASTDPNVVAAYTTLINNIPFIQDETIAYISSSWSTFQYDSVKCKRDIGFIVSGAAEDLLYGANSASRANGVAYYQYPSQATSTQLNQTIDAIDYASQMMQQLIGNVQFTTPTTESVSSYNTIRNNRAGIQNQTIEFINDALVHDFLRAWKYIREYIINDPAGKFTSMSLASKTKIGQLIDIPINTITSVVINLEPTYLQEFGSLVTSTSHDFSYAGSGVNFLGLPANQRGLGETNLDIRVVETDGGRVYTSFGDETGDFFVGLDFIIRQATGTIEGRTFNKATAARFTPLILALT